MARRVRKGKGSDESKNTLEPAQDLNCPNIIQSFEDKNLKEKQKTTRAKNRRQSLAAEETESHTIKEKARRRKLQHELVKEIEKEIPKKTTLNKTKSYPKEIDKTKTLKNKSEVQNNGDNAEKITSTEHLENEKEVTVTRDASPSWEIDENKLTTNFLTRKPSAETGFDIGLKPEKILGATEAKGRLYLIIQFKGDDEPHMVVNEVANKEIPQMVINFYEKCLWWQSDDEK